MARRDYTPALYTSPNSDNIEFGPAMKALNPRQQSLVQYLLDTGTDNWTEAVTEVGYTGSYETLRVTASRMRREPKIAAALVELGRTRPNFDLPMALKTIRTIAADPSHKDAGKMALALAAMSGISPIARSEQQTTVTHTADPLLALEAKLALLPPEIAKQLRETLMPPERRMIDVTPEHAGHHSDERPDMDGPVSDIRYELKVLDEQGEDPMDPDVLDMLKDIL